MALAKAARFAPAPVAIRAQVIAERLDIDCCDSCFSPDPGEWYVVEHVCHELAHLLFEGRPWRLGALDQIPSDGEAMAWAVTLSALAELGCSVVEDEAVASNAALQSVSIADIKSAESDSRHRDFVSVVVAALTGDESRFLEA